MAVIEPRPILPPILRVRQVHHFLERAHHWVPWVGVAWAVWGYLREFDWNYQNRTFSATLPVRVFHLELETKLGLALAAIGGFMKAHRRITLSVTSSLPFVLPDRWRTASSSNLGYVFARTRSDFEKLARLLSYAYPNLYVTEENLEHRADRYVLWSQVNPHLAVLMVDAEEELVGCSVVLRVSRDSYILFRNGLGKSWSWKPHELVPISDPGDSFLCLQVFYCKKSVGEKGAAIHRDLSAAYQDGVAGRGWPRELRDPVRSTGDKEGGRKYARVRL